MGSTGNNQWAAQATTGACSSCNQFFFLDAGFTVNAWYSGSLRTGQNGEQLGEGELQEQHPDDMILLNSGVLPISAAVFFFSSNSRPCSSARPGCSNPEPDKCCPVGV